MSLKSDPVRERVVLDLSEQALRERIVDSYDRGDVFLIAGEAIHPADIRRMRITRTTGDSKSVLPAVVQARKASRVQALGISNAWYIADSGEDVTDHFITRPPGSTSMEREPADVDTVSGICRRFGASARALQGRKHGRSDFAIENEYDVQDLLLALLRATFDDVRPEEWTPSYLGGAARMDFLVKKERIVVEVKMTRNGLADKEVGEQLGIDAHRYGQHAGCDALVCFVYDPGHRVRNPGGLASDIDDLSRDGLVVRGVIVS